MKLAIPSTLMTCFEWWVYEFGGFFAGNPYLWCEIYISNYHGICAIYRIKSVKPASKIIGFRAGNTVCKGYNLFCVCNDQECWVKMSWQLNML